MTVPWRSSSAVSGDERDNLGKLHIPALWSELKEMVGGLNDENRQVLQNLTGGEADATRVEAVRELDAALQVVKRSATVRRCKLISHRPCCAARATP